MKKTDYAGIDYGRGMTNIDHNTNIRYGIIPQNEVLQTWADESEAVYPNEVECSNCEDLEPISFHYDNEGYVAEQFQDDTDIFITKSPYYTYSQFCSPCAPGAGYLMNEIEPCESNKSYCFGHDWFDNGKAPYTVYSVETNEKA